MISQGQDAYRAFAASQHALPLFYEPAWLDIVCEDGTWDAALSYNEAGEIQGAWAYYSGKSKGLSWLRLPPLTPMTALWISNPPDLPLQKQIAHRHVVIEELEKQLPQASIIELKLSPEISDWLPFAWKGYSQETRYTFRFVHDTIEHVSAQYTKSFQRNLRAAERYYSIEDGTVDDLFRLMDDVMERKEAQHVISKAMLENLVRMLKQRKQCKIFAARDTLGVQAIILTVWDTSTTYYLISGREKQESHDANALLLHQAIGEAFARGQAFDFEGSMIRGVNRFFQNFGAPLVPYHYIYKYSGIARLKYL